MVPDQQIGPQVIDAAKAAGIPLMAADDVIEDAAGAEAAFAGFDGTAMGDRGRQGGRELYKAAGWTAADTQILSAYKQDLPVCATAGRRRQVAFAAALGAAAPEIIDIGTDNSATDAQDKAGAVITANPGVKNWVVWGCNDENETGVVTALQNAGVAPDNIIGVGLGAYLTCKDWQAGQDTGNKAALFISGVEVGKAAVTSMVAQFRDGTALPPKTIADTEIVDATTGRSRASSAPDPAGPAGASRPAGCTPSTPTARDLSKEPHERTTTAPSRCAPAGWRKSFGPVRALAGSTSRCAPARSPP